MWIPSKPAQISRHHEARVRLHLEDIQTLQLHTDRRSSRNVLDRLICTRFLHVQDQCLCTPEAKILATACRFDVWVHQHHFELDTVISAMFSDAQRSVLMGVTERYISDIEDRGAGDGPTSLELRFLQDWLIAPMELQFHRRFAQACVRHA